MGKLTLALRAIEAEHDPLVDHNLSAHSISELDDERWRELTEKAIYHVYKDIYNNPRKHAEAGLGPEDIRWFKVLFQGVER